MAKRAVCVGINDYPGTYNDLKGCVNDANDWVGLLREYFDFGDNITLMTDAEATKANILSALGDLVASAKSGDVVVFTYSGHGTWVYDQGERDESDNRDEAICAYDGNIIDDEIRSVIRKIDQGANFVIISDSCHSGSVTRSILKRTYDTAKETTQYAPKPRYMPPSDDIDALRTAIVPVRRRFLYPESGMPELLLTGCNATEYSYDAYIDGRYNGAMTALAIRIMKNNPKQTFIDFHKMLRQLLPSPSYQQQPQLEGTDANKRTLLFMPH
jgi:hypothetical protein